MADSIGWIGSIAFALCGLPQAWECYRNRSARGISPAFAALWLTGEICYVISVLMKFGWVTWMMFNYVANILSLTVIFFYLWKDRRAGA
ncbi:MAG: PQ-loop repeat-containing protein [Nitrospiraceae bacterium]|nr:MAG: PQ-loop repeat-containing protein [Nitrospiraceae bacterium]